MEYIPSLYSVTLGDDAAPPISVAEQRRALEAWIATLAPLALTTQCTGELIDLRFGDQRYRFALHAEAGTPEVREADPYTYVCTFRDGSRVQLFSRLLEPTITLFVPPSSGRHFRLDVRSVPMAVTLDQHATAPLRRVREGAAQRASGLKCVDPDIECRAPGAAGRLDCHAVASGRRARSGSLMMSPRPRCSD